MTKEPKPHILFMLESLVVGKYLSQQQISSRPHWPVPPAELRSYYFESHIHHPLKPAPVSGLFTQFHHLTVFDLHVADSIGDTYMSMAHFNQKKVHL